MSATTIHVCITGASMRELHPNCYKKDHALISTCSICTLSKVGFHVAKALNKAISNINCVNA